MKKKTKRLILMEHFVEKYCQQGGQARVEDLFQAWEDCKHKYLNLPHDSFMDFLTDALFSMHVLKAFPKCKVLWKASEKNIIYKNIIGISLKKAPGAKPYRLEEPDLLEKLEHIKTFQQKTFMFDSENKCLAKHLFHAWYGYSRDNNLDFFQTPMQFFAAILICFPETYIEQKIKIKDLAPRYFWGISLPWTRKSYV